MLNDDGDGRRRSRRQLTVDQWKEKRLYGDGFLFAI